MAPEAKDLVERLLRITPAERIGAGKPGSENDIEFLKRHQYFKGLSFENLEVHDVPLRLPEKMLKEFELIDNLIPVRGRDNIIKEGLLFKRNEWFTK